MINWLAYIFISCYGLFTVLILLGWWKAIFSTSNKENKIGSASIIIPFRNEELRISPLIISIKIILDKIKNVEFIFVDDHSDDGSISVLQKEFDGISNVKIFSLSEDLSGKKDAISIGISNAQFENIITTDADCELSEKGISSMLYLLEKENIKMVCGPVIQYSGEGLGARLADLEFLSLIGSGISFWGLGMPFMANGAFLGFKKEAFQTVNGFEGNEQFPGGDDVFLLQKMQSKFGDASIHFLSDSKDVVITKGDISFSDFIQRRIRWGAKAKAYQSMFSKGISVFIFLINLLYIISLFAFIFTCDLNGLCYILASKFLCDLILLSSFIFRFKKWGLLPYIIPATFLHPFYILLTGILSLTMKYDWKKRSYGVK